MEEMDERMEKQIKFILEADKLKNITRQTYIADGSRKENDAEHSWHLAFMTMLLGEYSNTGIDCFKVMQMVLIHDIIEIDAGDTYAYDELGNSTKREREKAAADRLFGILPKDQGDYMRGLWEEFEEGVTGEALFALAMDKIQPLLLNDAAQGESWREHGVKKSQIIKRNEKTPMGAQKLWEYCLSVIDENVKKGNIVND